MLAFFRRQNGRAFFPPLPIAALLRRSWRWADSNGGAWNVSALHSRFCKAKGQRHFKTMLAFGASRRPYRPTTVFSIQLTRKPYQTGEPWHPSCHGGNSAAKLLSFECPRALWARCGVQGVTPCREPWHPSCHGGKTPAKLHVPLRPCAPQARSPGCRGTTPAKRGSWRKGGRRSGRA